MDYMIDNHYIIIKNGGLWYLSPTIQPFRVRTTSGYLASALRAFDQISHRSDFRYPLAVGRNSVRRLKNI